MNRKKVMLYAISSVMTIGCIVGVMFAANRISTGIFDNATDEVVDTSTKAAFRYENALAAYNTKIAEQSALSDKSKDLAGINSNTTPEADTLLTLSDNVIQTSDGTYVYMIESGDTLCKISAQLLYSVDELAEHNHIQNVNLIYADSALRIPEKVNEINP